MRPIAIFFHGLFYLGDPPELSDQAVSVISSQMRRLQVSGLMNAASEFIVGINGGIESESMASMIIPGKAKIVMHGLESKSENLTLIEIEKWVPSHPNWNVFYFHAKGATNDLESAYGRYGIKWRECMMHSCVDEWREAVRCLESGYEAAGCHWLSNMGTDGSQHLFGGNFYWVKSDFLAMLPSLYKRDRIKVSGIKSAESRFEAEIILGNGPRLPMVKELATHYLWQCP